MTENSDTMSETLKQKTDIIQLQKACEQNNIVFPSRIVLTLYNNETKSIIFIKLRKLAS